MTEKTDSAEPRLSHARDYTRPGFYAKLVLMALINAFGLYGIMVSVPRQQWLVLGFLAVTLLVADYVYFSKRAIPAKYLLPGLVFLLVYQVYVMGSTAWVAFTNYGDGHNDSKQAAITQILKASDRRVEGTSTYPVTVVEKDGRAHVGFGFGKSVFFCGQIACKIIHFGVRAVRAQSLAYIRARLIMFSVAVGKQRQRNKRFFILRLTFKRIKIVLFGG